MKEPRPPTSVAMTFGRVLRAARKAAHLTQEQLAGLADLDRTYPSLIERGLRTPAGGVLLRIAAALNTPATQLIERLEGQLLDIHGSARDRKQNLSH